MPFAPLPSRLVRLPGDFLFPQLTFFFALLFPAARSSRGWLKRPMTLRRLGTRRCRSLLLPPSSLGQHKLSMLEPRSLELLISHRSLVLVIDAKDVVPQVSRMRGSSVREDTRSRHPGG